ncbi:MAG: 3-hydroxyacyl-CoA dehydrogenase family protein [Chloroflexi bacterium]|jgi:3-hydroxybutyryl-CoA dehydrogenase|nr:3-hydroxyacyl-CoA dehydrogenase family protein [Chloroflexota bacterium]
MKGKDKIVCNVAVIGAGTMGPGIAQVFAQAGCPVKLIDIDKVVLKQARERIKSSINAFKQAGVYGARKAEATLSNISFTANLAAGLKTADFIVEAIGENMELKRTLFKQVEKFAPAGAIIASNTSTFSIDDLAKGSKRAGKYMLTHFVNPPHVIPLIEVARGEKTSDKTYKFTLALLKQAGKRPLILKKMIPGHLINNFNFAILSTALGFMGQGIASIEDIDRALTEALGPRYSIMGPFKTMDLLGLNIIWQSVTSFDPNAHSDPRIKELRKLYQAGKLGMRSGAGFYDYSDKTYFDTLNYYNRRILETYKTAQEK